MFVTVEDAKLFALSFGARSSPAILALSGWIGSWESWADPAPPSSVRDGEQSRLRPPGQRSDHRIRRVYHLRQAC